MNSPKGCFQPEQEIKPRFESMDDRCQFNIYRPTFSKVIDQIFTVINSVN